MLRLFYLQKIKQEKRTFPIRKFQKEQVAVGLNTLLAVHN